MKRREIWVKISIRPNMVLEIRDFSHLAKTFTEEKERKEEEKRRNPGLEIDIGWFGTSPLFGTCMELFGNDMCMDYV